MAAAVRWRPALQIMSMSEPMDLARKERWVTLPVARSASTPRPTEAAAHGHDHHDRWHGDLLQGLGLGPSDRFQPRLAALGRRLGHPDAVLPAARLPRHRP